MNGDGYLPMPSERYWIIQSRPSKTPGCRDEAIVGGYDDEAQALARLEIANAHAAEGAFFFIKTKENKSCQ